MAQKFCLECGKPLIEGKQFCGECGAEVASAMQSGDRTIAVGVHKESAHQTDVPSVTEGEQAATSEESSALHYVPALLGAMPWLAVVLMVLGFVLPWVYDGYGGESILSWLLHQGYSDVFTLAWSVLYPTVVILLILAAFPACKRKRFAFWVHALAGVPLTLTCGLAVGLMLFTSYVPGSNNGGLSWALVAWFAAGVTCLLSAAQERSRATQADNDWMTVAVAFGTIAVALLVATFAVGKWNTNTPEMVATEWALTADHSTFFEMMGESILEENVEILYDEVSVVSSDRHGGAATVELEMTGSTQVGEDFPSPFVIVVDVMVVRYDALAPTWDTWRVDGVAGVR